MGSETGSGLKRGQIYIRLWLALPLGKIFRKLERWFQNSFCAAHRAASRTYLRPEMGRPEAYEARPPSAKRRTACSPGARNAFLVHHPLGWAKRGGPTGSTRPQGQVSDQGRWVRCVSPPYAPTC